MPWKVSDVEKHKKGLTIEEKKKWVSIANRVLTTCKKNGETNCDAKAIRIANSQVNVNAEWKDSMVGISLSINEQIAYVPRIETLNDTEYLVVPVVMMVEGVHNGSKGPTFHSAEELEKTINYWEGKPVTLSHPQIDGYFVSASTDKVIEEWGVGFVTNAEMKDKKLTAEVYIDPNRLSEIDPDTLEMVRTGKIVEVSVGVFTEDQEVEGEWNGEKYIKISKNHVPDHLALLPGEVGACSVNDGCGLRVNNEKKKGGKNVIQINKELLKSVNEQGFKVHPIVYEESLSARIDKIIRAIYSLDTDKSYNYVEEVYETSVVYVKREEGQEAKLFKQFYQINEDQTVSLIGDPIQVIKKVEYLQINKKVDMCKQCPEKAKMLVESPNTNFVESDLEWLSELGEDKLDKMIPKLNVNKQPPTLEEAWRVIQANQVSLEDYLKALPVNIKSEVEKGLQLFKELRSNMVKNILENTEKDTWKEEELNEMSVEVLQKIEKSIQKSSNGNYSLLGVHGSGESKNEAEVVMLP
jgi:hypothetical protein